MKIYRIIEYDGDEEWINNQLDNSNNGVKIFPLGKVTIATISINDYESIDIARNWLQNTQAVIRRINKEDTKEAPPVWLFLVPPIIIITAIFFFTVRFIL